MSVDVSLLSCSSHEDRLANTGEIRYAENPNSGQPYSASLRESNDFQEVFEVVRRSVKEFLGEERVGLELYLRDLPLEVGAFHKVGTDIIVMNRALINLVVEARVPLAEVKSFVYSILLHEYLHSLGIYCEPQVRRLTYQISKEAFGEGHPATALAKMGPWAILNWGLTSGGRPWS